MATPSYPSYQQYDALSSSNANNTDFGNTNNNTSNNVLHRSSSSNHITTIAIETSNSGRAGYTSIGDIGDIGGGYSSISSSPHPGSGGFGGGMTRARSTVQLLRDEDSIPKSALETMSPYIAHLEPPTNLEEKHQQSNFLFGIRPWSHRVTKKRERSEVVRGLYETPTKPPSASFGQRRDDFLLLVGNAVYMVIFGWWVSVAYFIAALLLLITYVGRHHAFKCVQLAKYYLWPFEKYIERIHPASFYGAPLDTLESASLIRNNVSEGGISSIDTSAYEHTATETEAILPPQQDQQEAEEQKDKKKSEKSNPSPAMQMTMLKYLLLAQFKNKTPAQKLASAIFLIFFAPVLFLVHLACASLLWFLIVFIPMAKVHFAGSQLLFKDILTLDVGNQVPPPLHSDIILCTYQAVNRFYYKYSVGGMNVILVNLIPFIGISLILGYACPAQFQEDYSYLIFFSSLLSVIPLAYYIGMAVSSISAQTSFAIGAVLNATFGSVIELMILIISLRKGLGPVVQNAVTGSLLANMLFMPGISMVFGGIKFKEQYFNKHAAGVSSTMLFVSALGAFAPSIFYQIYGNYQLECDQCAYPPGMTDGPMQCGNCEYVERNFSQDKTYESHARPLMYMCSAILPVCYLIGLLFTHKTHAYLYEQKPKKKKNDDVEEQHVQEEEGNIAVWSKTKCILILLVATVVYSFVAEKLADSLTPALNKIGVPADFAGLTLLAIVPSTAEFVNAIRFALGNNISLSLEIGSVSAIQICLIQMPALVFISAIFFHDPTQMFTLMFPRLNLFIVFFSIIVLNYIMINGRSNYFDGSALLLIYIIIIGAFGFIPRNTTNTMVRPPMTSVTTTDMVTAAATAAAAAAYRQ